MSDPAGNTPVSLVPTVNLRQDTHLDQRVTALIKKVADRKSDPITTAQESMAVSDTLQKLQQLRRFIDGVYKDAKRPLTDAKKQLDGQHRTLLAPLKEAEAALTEALLTFQEAQEPAPVPIQKVNGALPAPAPMPTPTLVPGMGIRTHYRAEVTDIKALVIAVAAQLLVKDPDVDITKVTRKWLMTLATPQATLDLVRPDPVPLNSLARALKEDLQLPGVVATQKPSMVSRG
jgi:hypothetical protein